MDELIQQINTEVVRTLRTMQQMAETWKDDVFVIKPKTIPIIESTAPIAAPKSVTTIPQWILKKLPLIIGSSIVLASLIHPGSRRTIVSSVQTVWTAFVGQMKSGWNRCVDKRIENLKKNNDLLKQENQVLREGQDAKVAALEGELDKLRKVRLINLTFNKIYFQ